MSSKGLQTGLQRTMGWMVESVATAFVTVMAVVSMLRLLGILSWWLAILPG